MTKPIRSRRAVLALTAAALLAACSDTLPSGGGPQPGGPAMTITPTTAFSGLDAGANHACALASGGQAWCWGRNSMAELGDSSAAPTLVPVQVHQSGGLAFTQVTAGAAHSCAITSSGAAYCWGSNGDSRLGDSTTALGLIPQAVNGGISFAKIHAGGLHTCGLDGSGQAYCFGYNAYGQIGNNSTSYAFRPKAVVHPLGVTFTQIAAGYFHSCALDGSTGQAYCWGYGGNGAVGDNGFFGSTTPVAVDQPSGVTFTQIATEYSHSCAVSSTGQAYCWGENGSGQLGDSTTVDKYAPVAVKQPSGVSFVAISTGDAHTCARTAANQVYCWGGNGKGQLGRGNGFASRIPVAVAQPSGVTFPQLSNGSYFTCAIDTNSQAYCWGRGDYGQLGNGGTSDEFSPVAVSH